MSEAVTTPFQGRPVSDHNRLSTGMIHAVVIQNILQGSFVRSLSRTQIWLFEIFLLLVFLYLSIRFSTLGASLGAFLLSGSVIIIGAAMFVHFNLIMRFVQPLLVLYGALIFFLSASAIERAMLLAETERARRLAERELEIGREIQTGFFPNTLPSPGGWELVTHFQAARHVSGDFYDAFPIGKKGDIGFVVADVCDKGVGAALFMALFRSLIRVLSGSEGDGSQLGNRNSRYDPARTLKHTFQAVNNYISITHEADSMFSTIFFGILNPRSGLLSYINGGHEPPIIIGSQQIKTYLKPTGPAVGIYPNAVFSVRDIRLEPEDILLAYTDGVIDAQNKAGEYFAKDRFTALITDSGPSARSLIDRIVSNINEHKKGQDQFDDITILALRREAMGE
jgi:serine phosphatase RsbU (regulator of sigma subunit)